MRALPRLAACYRATLWFAERPFPCLTHDLHGAGACLHFALDLPRAARVGGCGRLALDLRAFAGVEFECEVRHVTGRDVGLRFVPFAPHQPDRPAPRHAG